MKRTGVLAILLCLVTAGGCVDMSEEIWFNADGTGRMVIDLGVAEGLMALAGSMESDPFARMKEVEEELRGDPDVEAIEIREYSEGGMRHFVYDVTVKDSRKLAEVHQRTMERSDTEINLETVFTIEDMGRGRIRFKQQFAQDAAEAAAGDVSIAEELDTAGLDLGSEMMAALFADRYIVVTVHAPKIEEANGEISEDGGSVVWRLPLAQMIAQDDYQKSLEAVVRTSLTIGEKIKSVIGR